MAISRKRRPEGQPRTCANLSSVLSNDTKAFNRMRVICEYRGIKMSHLIKELIESEWVRFERVAKVDNPRKLVALQVIFDLDIPQEELDAILKSSPTQVSEPES
jgi:hypothetical protein